MPKRKRIATGNSAGFLSGSRRSNKLTGIKTFSPKFMYAMCKKLDGLDWQSGTTAWWGVRVDKGFGACEQILCPHDSSLTETNSENLQITQEMIDNAYHNRSFAYERLLSVIDIKKVFILSKLGGASLSFVAFDGIYDAPQGHVPLPAVGEESVGVHCVAIIGYDDNHQSLVFANSWGTEWGDNGIGYLPYSYGEKYTVECWAAVPRLYWKEFSQDLGHTNFTDRKDNVIKVQLHKIQSIVYGRSPLWVMDLYGSDRKIMGWSHFRIVDSGNVLEIEDVFIHPQFRNQGLGTHILEVIENISRSYFISEVRGWISVQDLIAESESIVSRYFVKAGFEIISDTKKFKGSCWEIRKELLNNHCFDGNGKKIPPKKVDDTLNEIIARCPRRKTLK